MALSSLVSPSKLQPSFLSVKCATGFAYFVLLDHPNLRWGVETIKLIMQPSPHPCYLIPSRPKYFPRHAILQHNQPMFLPQNEWPRFMPEQNKTKLECCGLDVKYPLYLLFELNLECQNVSETKKPNIWLDIHRPSSNALAFWGFLSRVEYINMLVESNTNKNPFSKF